MSQQGERSTGHEDDWWGQLYDDSTEDTGPTAAGDSLDDRFASASGTVDTTKADAIPGRDGRDGGGGAFGREPVPGNASGASEGSRAFDEWDESVTGAPPQLPPPPSRPVPPPAPTSPPKPASPPVPSLPPQRDGVPHGTRDAAWSREPGQPRAPWEPPAAMPPSPASFPPGPKPPGFQDRTQPPAPGAAFVDEGGSGAAGGLTARESVQGAGADMTEATDAVRDAPPHSAPRDATPADLADPAQDGFLAESSFLRRPVRRTPTRRDVSALPPETAEPPKSPDLTSSVLTVGESPATVDHVGSGPPTYAPEPTALPPADPDDLGDLVADTVLDGAQYGACTLRAVSLRGDSARFRGEPRRDSLLTARFGSGDHALVLIAMATGARATPGAHRAAAEACQWIGRAVGRSHVRLAEDLRAARRGDLKSGLHRLTDRSLGKLRASAAEQGIAPEEYTAGLRCLLLPADPDCRTRVFFGVGAGGLFRLRDGEWQDIEPRVTELPAGEPVVGFGSPPHETPDGDRLTMDLGITTPPSPYEPAPEPPREPFRFRASVGRPGDTLLLCTGGLAEPLRGEPELCEYLTGRWSGGTPPGLAAFLADTQVRVKGYADDRTAAAVWEM
ncbi:protein phosphatase 2C domain-containing protein [Streptomyces sp. SID12488]|uniref:protein phosphatase 2C domain-containing protein n=1 Tax=Streptomyces sp. SID12488 TaxID=2706040 RepID=UPI0013DB8420|nr:protein phosphatase 2C domain-containing protein [Streptomyces sp. SID12488]NEA67377.1 protein phosphatase 2C domain-containing protein [Streptomyces sp. SID12488]